MVTPEMKDEALVRYEAERQELVRQLKEKDENIRNLKDQLVDQREQICDEIRVMVNADPTIAEDYFRVMAIINHVEKGEQNETNL